MEKPYYEPGSAPEPYFRPAPDRASQPSRHPVSQEPYTEPSVSSITVRVVELDEWENNWLTLHAEHAEPDDQLDPDFVRFGLLPDYDPDEDEEGPDHLLVCCGTERPRNNGLKVLVQAAAGFVTVHDFLSAVHPQLVARREDLLGSLGFEEPLPPETKLMVTFTWPPTVVTVMEEKD